MDCITGSGSRFGDREPEQAVVAKLWALFYGYWLLSRLEDRLLIKSPKIRSSSKDRSCHF